MWLCGCVLVWVWVEEGKDVQGCSAATATANSLLAYLGDTTQQVRQPKHYIDCDFVSLPHKDLGLHY